MSDKAQLKRQLILERAKAVFAQKGYLSVTMKDIVDACEISRGGLYLYFDSVDAIFQAVLNEDDELFDIGRVEMAEDSTVLDLLTLFLKFQKKKIVKKDDCLSRAVYEYFLKDQEFAKDSFLKKQFDYEVKVLSQIIELGMHEGEFYATDAKMCAYQMMLAIEGMKIKQLTTKLNQRMIDRQFAYFVGNLLVE